MHSDPQLQVGLISDIHYDGSAAALTALRDAVGVLNRGEVDVLIVPGDLANGQDAAHTRELLREIAAVCREFRGPVYYMPGNHDLDHLSKSEFYEALGRDGAEACFDVVLGGWRLAGLDGNCSPDGTEYARGNFDWKAAFVPEEQLRRLRRLLDGSDEPVVLFSHQRIDQASPFAVQNCAAVRELLRESGKVHAVIQGHQHAAELLLRDGIAYYTLRAHADGAGPAVLELSAGELQLIRNGVPATERSSC